MFGLGTRKSSAVYGALIDIASGSVGVAIVSSQSGSRLPELIFAHRTVMRLTKYGGRKDENLRRIREALFSASLLLSQEGFEALRKADPRGSISKLYVICSSPWAFTIARNVHYEDNEPFKVSKSIIDDLIESAESEMITHLRNESSLTDEGFTVVERETVDVAVNDYLVHHPIGLKGTVLSLSHIAGLIPRQVLDAILEVRSKLFASVELRSHTYMLVMYCVLRDLFPRVHSLCIIDVTGEATEFGIVENNLLIENTYIPHGFNTFIRNVMAETGKPASDIAGALRDADETQVLKNPEFKSQVTGYESQVAAAITAITERRTLPLSVVITAHRPFQEFFKTMVTNSVRTATGKEPTLISIEQHVIDDISHNAADDVYLALSARFFHKLHGCGDLEDE